MINKSARRLKIRRRVRRAINGTAEIPRLSVYRSNKQIYCQLIDDVNGVTLCATSSTDKSVGAKGTSIEVAKLVGKSLAEKATAEKIEQVVFDRGGYLYHGRVKALAEGAREGGLKF